MKVWVSVYFDLEDPGMFIGVADSMDTAKKISNPNSIDANWEDGSTGMESIWFLDKLQHSGYRVFETEVAQS